MALTKYYEQRWNEKFLRTVSYIGGGATNGTNAVNETLDLGNIAFQIQELRVMADATPLASENFTLTLDSGAATAAAPVIAVTNWDQLIYSVDLSVSDVPHQHLFDARRTYGPADVIDIDYTNTDGNIVTFELIIRVND